MPGLTGGTVDGIRASGLDEPEQLRFDWTTTVTRDAWLDQVPTAAGHNRLPRDTLDALLQGMAEVIDAAGGSFAMTYATIVVTASAGR